MGEHGDTAGAAAVVETLAAHEDALGDLYATYAVKFPEAAHLWESLSAEEYGHGSLVRELGARAGDGAIFVDDGRFQVKTLRLARDFVLDITTVAENSQFSLERALGIAYDLEQAVIEQRAYEVVDGDSEGVRAVLDKLRQACEVHRDRLREYLDRLHAG